MNHIGDLFSQSTETFILGIAHFMPHPRPPTRGPKTRRKRKKRKCATQAK